MTYRDLELLLESTPPGLRHEGYREELEEANVLGKRTATNKVHTARKLRALYGLDPSITVFRVLREFWELDDGPGRPVMALLCATARDPLLRSLTPVLLKTTHGAEFPRALLKSALEDSTGDRFSTSTRRSSVSHMLATWLQSGHLEGRARVRSRPVVTPAATAYALALGYLEGRRGMFLFTSLWARILDAPVEDLRELAQEASVNGWIVYRGAGDVVEVRFPGLWTKEEMEWLDDEA